MRVEMMVGHILGHYHITNLLGQGGTSTVFLANDVNLHREVAVKLFQSKEEGDTKEFLRRFAREARVLAQLDHPNILPIYEYGQQDGHAYLVVPYMAGGSLKDLLRVRGPIPPEGAVQLITTTLNALQYAHDRGLIHRDIKPGNMLFKADGTLVLCDFGLVKVLSTDRNILSMQGTTSVTGYSIAGTPDYMAPEQIVGHVSPASDIYSVGVVLYEMLTGIHLFTSDNVMGVLMQHLYEQPLPLRQANPQISPRLEAVVLRALAKDPTRRYQRPIDLRQALIEAIVPNDPVTPFNGNQQSFGPMKLTSSGQAMPVAHAPKRLYSHIPLILKIALIVTTFLLIGSLVAAFTTQGLPGSIAAQTPVTQSHMPTSVPTTRGGTTTIVAPTSTTCPGAGSARAAVMPRLTLGNHPDVVFIANEFHGSSPTFGTLKRYDVTTKSTTEIVRLVATSITEAHISQDGQWILFTAKEAGRFELSMVRIDGKDLQTLHCAPSNQTIFGTEWTYDQRVVVFDEGIPSHPPTTYLLAIATGALQSVLVPSSNLGYLPHLWISSTKLYVTGFIPDTNATPANSATQNIYILDTKNGPNQNDSNLQRVVSISQSCVNFDSSYDNNNLFLSQCTGGFASQLGPSSITVQLATGSTQNTIYSSSTLAVTTVRNIIPTVLLIMIENTTGDTSQNGLWRIDSDGTELHRLTKDLDGSQGLCPYAQYDWSNVSRDHTLYGLQSYNSKTNTYGVGYGPLSGGPFTQVALLSGTEMHLVGWTTD